MNRFHQYLIVVIRVVLGSVFLWASFDKIIDPAKFAKSIANYHVLPFGIENTIAIVLPWLELFIGSGLILGVMIFIGTLGGTLGPWVTGLIFDVTRSYDLAFIILTGFAVLGIFLALFLRILGPIKI